MDICILNDDRRIASSGKDGLRPRISVMLIQEARADEVIDTGATQRA